MYACIGPTETGLGEATAHKLYTYSFFLSGVWAMKEKGRNRSSTLLSGSACPAEGARPARLLAAAAARFQIFWLPGSFFSHSEWACRWMRGVGKTKQIADAKAGKSRSVLEKPAHSPFFRLSYFHFLKPFLVVLFCWGFFEKVLFCC
jgi:hypothetical protein